MVQADLGRAEAIRMLAREEAAMIARHTAAYQTQANFDRRHSIGRNHDAEMDAWGRRVDALAMDDAEYGAFMAARCGWCNDTGAIVDASGPEGLRDCPRCRP